MAISVRLGEDCPIPFKENVLVAELHAGRPDTAEEIVETLEHMQKLAYRFFRKVIGYNAVNFLRAVNEGFPDNLILITMLLEPVDDV